MRVLTRIADFPRGVPIYLYGAGAGGRLVRWGLARRNLLRRRPIRVAGFIDKSRRGRILRLPILSPDEFAAARPQAAVVVITSQYVDEIARDLARLGVTEVCNGYPCYQDLAARRRPGWLVWLLLAAVLAGAWERLCA